MNIVTLADTKTSIELCGVSCKECGNKYCSDNPKYGVKKVYASEPPKRKGSFWSRVWWR